MLAKLGKLLKYEFRFYVRSLPPLYLILLLLSLPAGIQVNKSGITAVLPVLLTTIWGIIIGAMVVANLVLIIQRFTSNLLRNPGSLMFTLPVTTWALTASKAIAALCTVLVSIIVITASALIYSFASGYLPGSMDFSMSISPVETIVSILMLIILIFGQICLLYTAISASHILPKFRAVAGILIYFAIINFIEVPLFRFIFYLQSRSGLFSEFSAFNFYKAAAIYGVAGLALAALFFWSTGFLFKKTLNLE